MRLQGACLHVWVAVFVSICLFSVSCKSDDGSSQTKAPNKREVGKSAPKRDAGGPTNPKPVDGGTAEAADASDETSADASVSGAGAAGGSAGSGGSANVPSGRCSTTDATSCASTEFCNSEPDEDCGTQGKGGMCEPRPESCVTTNNAVCGCDGRSYRSPCSAHADGISIKSTGRCPDGGPLPGSGGACGGPDGVDCPDGEFCNYETTAGGQGCPIKVPNASGICQTKPTTCPNEYVPVCGCDQRSYGTICNAHQNGQAPLHEGECDQVDCKAVGGHLVAGTDCPMGEGEFTVSIDTSGPTPIEGVTCCVKQ